jgi:hypothetical protein
VRKTGREEGSLKQVKMQNTLNYDEAFEAYFFVMESRYPLSIGEITNNVLHGRVEVPAVAKAVLDLSDHLAARDAVSKRYKKWRDRRMEQEIKKASHSPLAASGKLLPCQFPEGPCARLVE